MSMSLLEEIETLSKSSAPILIVDSDVSQKSQLFQSLKSNGYTILCANSVESGIKQLKNHNISVVIVYHGPHYEERHELLLHAKEFKPLTRRILIGENKPPLSLMQQILPVIYLNPDFEDNIIAQHIQESFRHFCLWFHSEKLHSQLQFNKRALSDAQNWIDKEQILGKKIHQALLVDQPPNDLPGISIAVLSFTSNALDGDFVTFFRSSKHLLDFAIGDVMGKGLPSALVGTAIKGEITRFAEPHTGHNIVFDHNMFWHEDVPSIKEIIQKVHKSYVERLLNLEFFVSLFYGRLDISKRTLSFIDCGFTKPIYFHNKTKKATFIGSSNFPLGTVKTQDFFPFEVQYDEGDFFVFYSDGIIEAHSKEKEMFGEKRLLKIVEQYHELEPKELANKIREILIDFTGEKSIEDDFTLTIIKINNILPNDEATRGSAKFSSVLTQLGTVRTLIKECCQKAPGDVERLSNELQLVTDEIFTNVVLHGYENRPGSPICIYVEYLKDELMVEISDQGIPFDPFKVPSINLFGDQDHGYGWYLVRQLVDRVIYTPKKNSSGWNYLKLYKRYYTRRDHHMELTATEQDGLLILRIDSETLDAKQAQEFKDKSIQIISQKGIDKVVYDLQKLQFIDSSGLGAFLSLLRQLNTRGGHLCLAGMSPPVKTIFELVSMQKIFDCHPTINQAVQQLLKSIK